MATTQQQNKIFTVNKFAGVNFVSDRSQIAYNESPDMINFSIDDKGMLYKRFGYDKITDIPLIGIVRGRILFTKIDGTVIEILAKGTNLYTIDNNVLSSPIYTNLDDNPYPVEFFIYNDKLYILDQSKLLQYDGTTVQEPTPYVPTITISMSANGAGTTNEDFNLLGNRFKCSYSPNGTDTVFQLTLKNLDSSTVKASWDGGLNFNKIESTDLSVDRVNGKVTFTSAPTSGTNSLIIEAGYTDVTKQNMIKKAQFSVLYGGNNDTRVILSGNPNYPNRIWRSGLYDASYWPENKFTNVGNNNEPIVGFAKHYDALIILKKDNVWQMGFDVNNGDPIYTTRPLSDAFGCSGRQTIQILNNNPTWFYNKKGVVTLTQTNIRDERNIQIISEKVNNKLLNVEGINSMKSIDYDNKYFLHSNGTFYIYDYIIKVWYLWELKHNGDYISIDALYSTDSLCFGATGIINGLYRFNKSTDFLINPDDESSLFTDDGEAIECHWYSKLSDFNTPIDRKTVNKIFVTVLPSGRTSFKLYALDSSEENEILINNTSLNLFYYDPFYYDNFSYGGIKRMQTIKIKSKAKKVTFYQIAIKNAELAESLAISEINFEVIYQGYVK